MFRRIVFAIFSLIACLVVAYQVDAQQAPRGRGPSVPTPPPLFFKETWRIMGAPHAIAPGEIVVTNPNLEFKMYGPSATASDPDKRIWISGPPGPANIWTGMCTTPFAATLRDKDNYVDLTDARAVIAGARQGALFLMFRPGNTHTLIDDLELVRIEDEQPKLPIVPAPELTTEIRQTR